MKKVFILISTILLISCSSSNLNNEISNESKRIKIKETFNDRQGLFIYIIEVDGNEYLVNYHGGICLLEDTCKIKK